MGSEKKKSLRIIFSDEQYKFITDYKEAFGVSIQFFVDSAVTRLIEETKIKIDLGEPLPLDEPYTLKED